MYLTEHVENGIHNLLKDHQKNPIYWRLNLETAEMHLNLRILLVY